MARGWESKAVADQMEQIDERVSDQQRQIETSPAVRARQERLESLRLSSTRTNAQLERATSDTHREMLRRTLQALEREIAALE